MNTAIRQPSRNVECGDLSPLFYPEPRRRGHAAERRRYRSVVPPPLAQTGQSP